MTTDRVILGLVALVFVSFSLIVALVVPRRDPGFPGRRLRLLVVIGVLLVAATLAAVEVFGAEEEEGEEAAAAETAPAEEAPAEEAPAETTPAEEAPAEEAPAGDPEAGNAVFASAGCGGCHTFGPAGSSGTIGPGLDEALQGDSPETIRTSIVDPNAEITEGFQPNVMPQDFGTQLSEQELDDLVAFLAQGA